MFWPQPPVQPREPINTSEVSQQKKRKKADMGNWQPNSCFCLQEWLHLGPPKRHWTPQGLLPSAWPAEIQRLPATWDTGACLGFLEGCTVARKQLLRYNQPALQNSAENLWHLMEMRSFSYWPFGAFFSSFVQTKWYRYLGGSNTEMFPYLRIHFLILT